MRLSKIQLILPIALVVAGVYSLPLALAAARQHYLMLFAQANEPYYTLRVLDAFRGRSLANPYLSEHQDSPKYLPELIERTLAFAAYGTGISPVSILAATRILFPALIAALI